MEIAGENISCKEGSVKFRPSQEKLNALARVRSLRIKKEVQSLLGLVHQFNCLHCRTFSSTNHLRGLLRKHSNFEWNVYLQQEFEEINKLLAHCFCLSSSGSETYKSACP